MSQKNDLTGLATVMKSLNRGRHVPALSLVNQDAALAAVISKLVRPPDDRGRFNLKDKNTPLAINPGQLLSISENAKQRQIDNENIFRLFPDIELAKLIVCSSIMSPKDMINTEFIYGGREPIFAADVMMRMQEVMKEHLEGHYALDKKAPEMLQETMFDHGAYIQAILPESIIDEVINRDRSVSLEALSDVVESVDEVTGLARLKPMGFLGRPKSKSKLQIGTESFADSYTVTPEAFSSVGAPEMEFIDIADNFHALKLPKVMEIRRREMVKNIIGANARGLHRRRYAANIGMEDANQPKGSYTITASQFGSAAFKAKTTTNETFVAVPGRKNSLRKSIGRPLMLRLPTESVIPIHIPGNPKQHVAYFVLIDQDGNPVTKDVTQDIPEGLHSMSSKSAENSISSMLIAKAKKNLASAEKQPTLDHITQIWGEIVESQLNERLASGIAGANVKIGNAEEVYRIMLARSLANKYTRLLYIPAELVSYMAFKFFNNGVGKSYLDDVKNLTSLRAIVLFSKVHAQVKSSINVTHVNVTLDERDPDPIGTIEEGTHEIIRLRQQYFPLGINTPTDITNWLQRAGLELSFEGHPGLPNTKFDFETKSLDYKVPDTELDEDLRKQTYMSFGLSPEVVDNGFSADFATTVAQNNVLFSKRVLYWGTLYGHMLSDLACKIAFNDEELLKDLRAVVEENKAAILAGLSDEEREEQTADPDWFIDDCIERFLSNFEISLPKPDSTSLTNLTEAFNAYSEALEAALTAWISSDILAAEVAGEINTSIENIKAIIKAYYQRRWMAENGYLAELNDIVTADEDGKPTLDIYTENKAHLDGLIRCSLKFMQKMNLVKTASDNDLNNINNPPTEEDGPSGVGLDEGGDESEEGTPPI